MGPFYERRREGAMYPDERRVENTFIEIEVMTKLLGLSVTIQSINEFHTLPNPLIALNMVIPSGADI